VATSTAVPFPLALKRYPRIRQSVLAVFDACALGAKWKAEHEDYSWSSHPAARGQLVHRVIGRCLRLMVENGERVCPVEVAITEFDDAIRQADLPMVSAGEDAVVPLPLREIAQARVSVITWAKGTEWDIQNIVGIEKRLSAMVHYPDGQRGLVEREITGRLDLLMIEPGGWHAIVPDWKDTWAIPPEPAEGDDDEQISEEGFFQQRMYALLIFLTYPGIQRVTLREFYVRYATSTKTKPTREASIDRISLAELESEFAALVERFDRSVQEDAWKPAPGSHCWNCIQPESCPILPKARREGRVTNPEEAQRVAGWINVAEAALRRYRAALRPWTNRHGPIEMRDAKRRRWWGPVQRTRVERPSEEEMAWAVENGIDPTSLYKERTAIHFEAFSETDMLPQVTEAAETERMLLAARKRSDAARKGARTRAKRRRNGGNS
jgi:hypothetical protein